MKLRLAAAFILFAAPAMAQNAMTVTDLSGTITNSSAQCVAVDSGRLALAIENPSGASGNIGYCIGSCTASIGSAGTSVITPGNVDYWPRGSAPTGPVNCVASIASTPATIRSYK